MRITVAFDHTDVALILEQEGQRINLDFASWRRYSDSGCGAAGCETFDALLDHFQHTGAVDRVGRAACGFAHFLDVGHDILALLGVDQIGRAHRLGQLELGGDDIDTDDFLHAHGYCGHESRETNAAKTEDHDRFFGSGLEHVQDCACAGLESAAHGAEIRHRIRLGTFDDTLLLDHAVARKGRLTKVLRAHGGLIILG